VVFPGFCDAQTIQKIKNDKLCGACRFSIMHSMFCRALARFRALPRRNEEFCSYMSRDFQHIVIDEMSEAMIGDATQFCPLAQGANGRFATSRENSTVLQADYISESGYRLSLFIFN
jgi:hypothetical protein